MAPRSAFLAALAFAIGWLATGPAKALSATGPCAYPLNLRDVSQAFGGSFRAAETPLLLQVNSFREAGCNFQAVATKRGVTQFVIWIRRAAELEENLVLRRDAAQDLVDEGWTAAPIADLGDAAFWAERESGPGASHQLLLFKDRLQIRLMVSDVTRNARTKDQTVALARKVVSRLQASSK